MTLPEWRVFSDTETLVARLADSLCKVAEEAIAKRGAFHLVLAGGKTPQALYRELAHRHLGDEGWHIWYGDERCLPADHPERNSVMAEAAWLLASHIPPENPRPIPIEAGLGEYKAKQAVTLYAGWLAVAPDFDLVLLGMGEDGHTASLFPGQDWGTGVDSPDVLLVRAAPKPPSERISLSAMRLNRSARVWFMITGSGKHQALLRWKRGERLPVSIIQGKQETLAWLDQAANE